MLDIKKQLNNLIKIIICLCLTFTLLIVKPVSDVKANGLAAIPGYLDEMYAASVTAAMTVAAAGAHTHEFVQDNIELIRDGAKSAYETLAPEAKASFLESLNAAGDRISIAGDWITHALDSLKADPVINSSEINNDLYSYAGSIYTLKDAKFVTPVNSYLNGYSRLYVDVSRTSSTDPKVKFVYGSAGNYTQPISKNFGTAEAAAAFVSGFQSHYNAGNLEAVINALNTHALANISIQKLDGTVVSESIYSQLDKRLRETDLPSGQLDNLRIPQTIPHTPTGRVLQLDTGLGGLTLDGIPYTGDVTWRTQTDAGVVLPVPIPMLADQPLVLTREGVLVNERGEVVTDVSNVTWVRPDIINVTDQATGKPKTLVKTITGELIDIITGEIINKKEFDDDDDDDDDDGGLKPPCGCSVPSVVVNNNITIKDDDGGQGLSYCIDKTTRQVVPCGEIEAIDGSLLTYLKNSYDYAVNAVKTASDGLKSIVEGSTGLIALYSNIFDWLPDQVTVILTSGLLLMIGLRVFRR